jgi:hypothetical protein
MKLEGKHLEAGQLARLRRGELTPVEVIAVTTHLASCKACLDSGQASLDAHAASVVDRLLQSSAAEHPDPETDLTRYVDGTLPFDEQERVEAHLGVCERCSEDVEDLRAVARSLRPATDFASRRRLFLAVAATLIVVLTAIVLLRPHPTPQSPPSRSTVIRTEPPRPAAPPLKPEWESLVAAALRTGRVPMPDGLREIHTSRETVRGEAEPRRDAVSPAGEVVETDRPVFTWPAPKGAKSVVIIYRDDDQLAVSGTVRGNTWTPSKPLPRGVPLVWQVELRGQGHPRIIPAPPDPPAMFRIIDEASLEDIEAAKRLHPDNDLLIGLLSARAGLRHRAIESLRRHAAKRPEDAKLLRSVETWH